MKRKKYIIVAMAVILAIMMITGCAEYKPVEPGQVGKKVTKSGAEEGVLYPGSYDIWDFRGRTRIVLLDVSEGAYKVNGQALCQDKMNLPFTVEVRMCAKKDEANYNTIFATIEPDVRKFKEDDKLSLISRGKLYETYVAPVVTNVAKRVITGFETMEVGIVRYIQPEGEKGDSIEPIKVGISRAELDSKIFTTIKDALVSTPIELKYAAVTNIDYPEIVTSAVEKAKQREIEIKEEEATQKKRLIAKRNEEEWQFIDYRIKVREAQMIADFNLIIGSSINFGFLRWWQLKVFAEAAKGPNNWGFIPYDMLSPEKASALIPQMERMNRALQKTLGPDATEDLSPFAKEQMEENQKRLEGFGE